MWAKERMAELTIDRRRLLEMGLASGFLAVLPLGCVRLNESDASLLLDIVGDSELPVAPDRTGELPAEGFELLFGLCNFVDRGWQLGADLETYRGRLRGDLEVKVAERPSYLTEYERAIDLVEIVIRQSGSLEQAWATILFSEIDSEVPDQTRLGRARRLVYGEIVTHQVALSGGFRSFGVDNYSGYAAGPFTEEGSYRRGRT